MVSAKTIDAVCFDLDGLMFNTEHVFHEAGDILLRRRGHAMTRGAMNAMLGLRPLESFRSLCTHLDLCEEPADLLAESRIIFESLLDTRLKPMPGLIELLDRLDAAGLPMGVATSSPRDYLSAILGRFSLMDRFVVTLTAEDVTHGKPHPEIYLKAASVLGVSPEKMLVLEDTQTGTRAGSAAGAYVISVPHEHTADHDFSGARQIALGGLGDRLIYDLLGFA
ncbi:MAG: HAD family phosphatase [Planctomycetaceae bacterium]|nr:HAD family phosphatase [Planctomycetaceae bacterium]